jgi:hypothetical protein
VALEILIEAGEKQLLDPRLAVIGSSAAGTGW